MLVMATAPGKVILLGEHFVVHGGRAISMAIKKYVRVKILESRDYPLEIYYAESGAKANLDSSGNWVTELEPRILEPIRATVTSILDFLGERANLRLEISYGYPTSAGLGSSASLAAALVDGISCFLGHELNKEEVVELASASERIVHGNPSGIDLSTVVAGGVVLFDGSHRTILERISGLDLPLVVGDTLERRSTALLVEGVGVVKTRYPTILEKLREVNDLAVRSAYTSILKKDLETLGDLFNISHGLLRSLGVSTSKLDEMVHAALEEGALGAKLTGAGGGGCMIALVSRGRTRKVIAAIERVGGRGFLSGPDQMGVRSFKQA